MPWNWFFLISLILAANYLGVPSMLIGIANTSAVLIGANGKFRGTVRYNLAALVAFLLQSTVAITLSALIISYIGYRTSRNPGHVFAWVVGTIAAISPMWQTRSRATIERLSDPDAYVTKEATHKAIPYALVVTAGFTLLFVFRPIILDTLFYWLLMVSGLIYVCSIVSIFVIAFGPKPLSQSSRDSFDAHNAFTTGKKLFQEAMLIKGEGWKESQLIKIKEAVEYFDDAIEKGFDESEVFSLRGSCLNDFGFYFEALEDYNKAIEKRARKGIASNYHMRSVIKDSLFDFEGSVADLKEAIRLSKLDNDDNAYWNDYAKSTGFASQTAFYELCLPTEAEISSQRKRHHEMIEEELKKIKRRER